MNKVKLREKAYLTGKIKEEVTLIREEKVLSLISFGNNSQNFSKSTYQGTNFKGKTQQNITTPKGRDMPNNYVKNNEKKFL